jgi:hypothetical protein
MATLEEILRSKMNGRSVTQGWGAVAVISQAALNRSAVDNYVQRFNHRAYMPLVKVSLNDEEEGVQSEVGEIVFGTPLYSFEKAKLSGSVITMTLPIMAGVYSQLVNALGTTETKSSTSIITEGHGFKLWVEVELEVPLGYIDGQTRVIADLQAGFGWRTNIAGKDETSDENRKWADSFKSYYKVADPASRRWMLAKLNCIAYTPYSPASCLVRTQKDPESADGKGALVIFIDLNGVEQAGSPEVLAFPFLVPSDLAVDLSYKYTAALILAQHVALDLGEMPEGLTGNLFFPDNERDALGQGEIKVPHDLAFFGRVVPIENAYYLDSPFRIMIAGGRQKFELRDWKGELVTDANQWDWSALSLESHDPVGSGRIGEDGLYLAPNFTDIGHNWVRVVITAERTINEVVYTATALVLLLFQQLNLAPQLTVLRGRGPAPVFFNFDAPQADDTAWRLMEPTYGTLQTSANQATFILDDHASNKTLVVQELEARNGGDTRQAAAILCNGQQLLAITPNHRSLVKKNTTTSLQRDTTWLNTATPRWKVIAGNGTVSAVGEFTAPADEVPASNIVQCELVHNGVVFCSGYSVLDLSEREDEPTWEALAGFEVHVGTNLPSGNLSSNGYQQLQVTLDVQTQKLNDEYYPLSPAEQDSIRLVAKGESNIPSVFYDFAGIEPADKVKWRTASVRNRFDIALLAPLPLHQETRVEGKTQTTLYLSTRDDSGTEETFHAVLTQDKTGKPFYSYGVTNPNSESIVVAGQPAFLPSIDHYVFPGNILNNESPPTPKRVDGALDNDYHLNTIDAWALRYNGGIEFPARNFVLVHIEPQNSGDAAVLSMLRWESETYGEEIASFTGFVFDNTPLKSINDRMVKLDAALNSVSASQNLTIHAPQHWCSAGEFALTLHRRDDLQFRHKDANPELAHVLDRLQVPFNVRLVDKKGDVHLMTFEFPARSTDDHRNIILVSVRDPDAH